MITRAALVDAVAAELADSGDKAAEEPFDLGEAGADRLGLRSVPIGTADTLAPPAGDTEAPGALRGAGIWLRLSARPRPEAVIEHLDYVVVPPHSGQRRPIGRGPTMREWCAEVRGGGVALVAMDWQPRPGYAGHLEDLCETARELGCVAVMSDCEPDAGWRGAVTEARAYREELERVHGDLELAVTDYARGGAGPPTLRALLTVDGGQPPVGVPQSYDPRGSYRIDYHERGVAYWEGCGAERVVLGVGAWLAGERRHRGVDQMRRHLEHVPERVLGICAWYASLRGLRPLFPVLDEAAGDCEAAMELRAAAAAVGK